MDPRIYKMARLLPRLIRLRDAPHYLGMDRNRFGREVRPFVTVIRMGIQGITFDRLDLDAWVDQYKSRNGRPGHRKGDQLWDAKNRRASTNGPVSGISTNTSVGGEFAKALDRVSLQRQSATSQDWLRKPGKRRSTE